MSTSYYIQGLGENPKILGDLIEIKNNLENNGIPVPEELENRINSKNKMPLFRVYLDDGKTPLGISQIDNGYLVELANFPEVKFIEFGWC